MTKNKFVLLRYLCLFCTNIDQIDFNSVLK
uniref:Uncharacterized 3.5 kDa protein in ycf33-trnY intergenic region n=1 Tax=Trieres chinensis TaxID=1514140 RepID=YCX4_TRICV|nr:ORF29a [Trieres chinensis]P49830.1 RecName: Full=Uncharacterized 3.5 kDa protein in ycf33-trnY intergenic region; AltName: Full=ORF29A [Trieres chinensis]CAA91683.1 ORF29a [Trieres chinensis]